MYLMGIDVGTSAAKIIVLDPAGEIMATSSQPYPIHYPAPGWAEQDPEDWWQAVKLGISDVLHHQGVAPEAISGIGVTGQMHGLVILDRDFRVVRPAILWNDQRTSVECAQLTAQLGQDRLTKATGNKALTGFTAPKIMWLRQHQPELFDRVRHLMLPKDYIGFRLSSEFSTDVSDASGTLLFDVARRQWSDEMLNYLALDKSLLPEVYESSQIIGITSRSAQKETGLARGIPIVAGAGDQAAGAISTGTVTEGVGSVSLGTSGVVFAPQEQYRVDPENRLHTFCHANGQWHSMGVMLTAASALKWWVENMLGSSENAYEAFLSEAARASVGSDNLLFLPYLMGERTPYSNPEARGAFVGLTLAHGRPEMTRAILEGVSFGLMDCLLLVRELGIPVHEVRITGGGADSELWRQIVADVFNLEVGWPTLKQGPAVGAAMLAAVGTGEFDSVKTACSQLIKIKERRSPVADRVEIYRQQHSIYQRLYRDLVDRFAELGTASSVTS